MIALTLHPWWAWAVAQAGKTTENRSWVPGPSLAVGDWLYIHAGQRRPSRSDREALSGVVGERVAADLLARPGGQIVCRARYLGADQDMRTRWDAPGHAHWRLGEVEHLPDGLRCPGRLGLWRWPEAVAQARAA